MGGVPCIRGLRIPLATVVGMVAEGMTASEIKEVIPETRLLTGETSSDITVHQTKRLVHNLHKLPSTAANR